MVRSTRGTLAAVWALLSILTIGSWWTTRADGRSYAAITAAVLVFTLVKSRLVMRYFMEVRSGPRRLRLACDAWLLAVFGTIFALSR